MNDSVTTLTNGGELLARVLAAQGAEYLFTLCGGHISPILVGCKAQGIRVIDTRHEATAVFAADAMARLTGRPGVAAVTAGPGVTNTITALKNAQMAQSPVVLIGGAAPTVLQGRGALQDIDQMALVRPLVKWAGRVGRVRDQVPALETAFRESQTGVPGPVFVECPIDLLYGEETVRKMYGKQGGRSLAGRATQLYLDRHLKGMFAGAGRAQPGPRVEVPPQAPNPTLAQRVAQQLAAASCPLLLVGSQALLDAGAAGKVAAAVERIGAPVYLSGMARGLLGRESELVLRHRRREALREADFVLLAGMPCDFRLDYGRHIPRRAFYVSANRSRSDLRKNRRPGIGALCDPGLFLRQLAESMPEETRWAEWRASLRERDARREAEIRQQMTEPVGDVNPLYLLGEVDAMLGEGAIVVADGGDFAGTASYIVRTGGPLRWLDPGPFGTLGVGAGFALAAKLRYPEAEVWILYGDGAAGYSVVEMDTFVRHGLPVIAVVGNDAGWTQIAREQVDMLGDDVGTVLSHSDYHLVAEGLGAAGFRLDDPEEAPEVLAKARAAASAGRPALVNAIIGKTGFRKGSISI
ncbi:MAG: thiamine pyrophosphate-binding protein [Nitrososphaerales archaeon]